jgi:hypothetical protein
MKQAPRKEQKLNDTLLFSLSEDELSVVTSFMTVGENLLFSLSCKRAYNLISQLAHTKQPEVVAKKWSIASALRSHALGIFISSFVERSKMMQFMQDNEFKKICPTGKLTFDELGEQPQSMLTFFDFEREPVVHCTLEEKVELLTVARAGQITLPTIEFAWNTLASNNIDDDLNKIQYITKSISVPIVSGHEIRSLVIEYHLNYSVFDVFTILKSTVNLESLQISSTTSRRGKGTRYGLEPQAGGKQDTMLTLHHFQRLRRFVLIDCGLYAVHVAILLQMMPNLEEFDYEFVTIPGKQLLRTLETYNKKIKKLHIVPGVTAALNELDELYTGDDLLHLMSKLKLEEVTLTQVESGTSKLLENITNTELKHVSLRCVSCKEVQRFSSQKMTKLRELHMVHCFVPFNAIFVDSILSAAPNLKIIEFDYCLDDECATVD